MPQEAHLKGSKRGPQKGIFWPQKCHFPDFPILTCVGGPWDRNTSSKLTTSSISSVEHQLSKLAGSRPNSEDFLSNYRGPVWLDDRGTGQYGNDWRKFRVVPRVHPLRSLVCTLFNKGGSRRAFRLPGAGGGSFPLYGGTFARSYSVPKIADSNYSPDFSYFLWKLFGGRPGSGVQT